MALSIVAIKSGSLKSYQRTCRLCMGQNNLEDVFEGNGLHQWISNYLSIRIYNNDCEGHAICSICRLRLSDFHQFRTRCQEVQAILQSMVRDDHEASTWLAESTEYQKMKTEHDDSYKETEQESHGATVMDNKEESHEIDIEQVKIETRASEEESLHETDCGEHTSQNPDLQTDNLQKNHEYSCSKCHKTFSRQCLLKMHISSHDEKIREEQATDTDDEELSSKKAGENNVKDYKFRCNQCDRSYPDEKRLKWHMRCHRSKTHICPICGKPFSFWFLLKNHIPRHDPNHVRQPWGEATNGVGGPFRCDICQKEYGLKSRLRSHKAQVHAPKRHECHMCDSKYTTRASLRKHIRSHYRANGKG